MGGSDLKLIRG